MTEEDSKNMKDAKNGVDFASSDAAAECDPCIDTKRQEDTLWNSAVRKVRDRTGLTRWGVYLVGGLLIVLVVLFITVVALGASWPHTPHHQLFPICKDSACLRASAQVSTTFFVHLSP